MKLSWDANKRQKVLLERGLDMADVQVMFEGRYVTDPDTRFDYGEDRFVTYGFLNTRLCAVVWTMRGAVRHIISLRKTNDREQKIFKKSVG